MDTEKVGALVGVLGLVALVMVLGITAVILKLKLDDANRRLNKLLKEELDD